VCVVELHITADSITYIGRCTKMLLWRIYVACKKKEKVRRSSRRVPDAAMEQKNVPLLMAFFRRKIMLHRSNNIKSWRSFSARVLS